MKSLFSLFVFLLMLSNISSNVNAQCLNIGLNGKCIEKLTLPNGNEYAGEMLNGEPNGYGTLIIFNPLSGDTGEYRGYFTPGGLNGFGQYRSIRGNIYYGNFQNNRKVGTGVFIWNNGSKYVGEWNNDRRNGLGIEYHANGLIFESGFWVNNSLTRRASLDVTKFPFDERKIFAEKISEINEIEKRVGSSIPKDQPLNISSDNLSAREKELEKQLVIERQERERLAAMVAVQAQQQPQPVKARNERRVALIIGNSAYKVSPLDNPSNDAADIADSLRRSGFNTTLIRNATLGQMRDATRRFADLLPNSDVALIYFAGHGIESNRKNFMIPVNADIKFEYELSDQAYDASIWLDMLETIKSNNADRVNIVILDACRNNSLIGSRSLGRGLGKMDAPAGTFLAYSTAPGKVAADGVKGERNSPFTKHLLRAMSQPGVPIEEVFKEVRRNVVRETSGAQIPWESTSLTGYFTFNQPR